MSSDPGARDRRLRPHLGLPRPVSVTARLVSFEPPRHRHFDSALPRLERTVELLVETDGPIPARGLSPVLYVGEVPVTEVVADDETHYRFVAMEPERLREGAPITLGWSGMPVSDGVATGASFVAPSE